jgi:hypothetical protein
MSNCWPFHIKLRPGPLNVPAPRSVTLYIWLAVALICVSAVACH